MIDLATIIFLIALLGIVGMIFFKMQQLKTGKQSFLSELGESTDHHVHAAYDKTRYFFSHFNRKTAIALVQWIAFHILSWLRKGYHWLWRLAHRHPHSKRVIDMVRGRGEVDKNSGSSFYLKHIETVTVKPKPEPKEHVAPASASTAYAAQAETVAEIPEK